MLKVCDYNRFMREELKYAALYGPEIIPYFRRKLKSRPREITHQDVESLLKRVKHEEWDWNEALGDTIKEKYESLWLRMFELTKEQSKLNVNANLVIASPELSSIFETSCSWWPYADWMARKDVYRVSNISNRWTLYKDMLMPTNLMLLTRQGVDKGVAINVVNLII